MMKQSVERDVRFLPDDERAARAVEEEAAVDEPTRHPYRSGFFCIALAALAAVGCASHGPLADAKVSQAERAVEEAQQAGAAVRAPLELRTAQDKLRAAQTAATKGKNDEAIRAAEQATIDGEYARAVATSERVNANAGEMSQYIKVLRQEIERLPK